MSQQSCFILNWNVRGLNNPAKRDNIKLLVDDMKATIVCLQETKIEYVSDSIVSQTLGGGRFVAEHAFLPADGTRGGILLACDDNYFCLSNIIIKPHSLSATVTMKEEGLVWSITVVYGPQLEEDKILFLNELQELESSMHPAWLIIRDFNLINKASDKNNDRLNRRMMQRFKGTIDRIGIRELTLSGRCFTWAQEGANPTQTKIDRAFCSPEWDTLFCSAHMSALSSSCSDHAPLFVVGCEQRELNRSFRFESYRLKMPDFLEVTANSWNRPIRANPFAIFHLKLCRLARDLRRWSKTNIGDLRLRLAIANEVIFQLDVAQESRSLSDVEQWLLKELKRKVLGLASMEKIRIRQRSRLTWIKCRDVNSKYFHLKANSRKRKNFINALQTPTGTAVTTDKKSLNS